MPVLRILVLALALAQAGGVTELLESACTDDCTDVDCDDGGCAPICPACHCAPRAPVNVTAAATADSPLRASTTTPAFDRRDDVPINPDPNELLRPPIFGAA